MATPTLDRSKYDEDEYTSGAVIPLISDADTTVLELLPEPGEAPLIDPGYETGAYQSEAERSGVRTALQQDLQYKFQQQQDIDNFLNFVDEEMSKAVVDPETGEVFLLDSPDNGNAPESGASAQLVNGSDVARGLNGTRVTQGYGKPNGKYGYSFHDAIDIAAPNGTALYSPTGTWQVVSVVDGIDHSPIGTITKANNNGFGNQVIIQNTQTGEKLRFSHLAKGSVAVQPGQVLNGNVQLGAVGNSGNSTGAHLDLGYSRNGSTYVNPMTWSGISFYTGQAGGGKVRLVRHYNQALPKAGAGEPTTLWEYYNGNLPSLQDRAALFERLGLGDAADYRGSETQNIHLLDALQRQDRLAQSTSPAQSTPDQTSRPIDAPTTASVYAAPATTPYPAQRTIDDSQPEPVSEQEAASTPETPPTATQSRPSENVFLAQNDADEILPLVASSEEETVLPFVEEEPTNEATQSAGPVVATDPNVVIGDRTRTSGMAGNSVSQEYGRPVGNFGYNTHYGMDIAADEGTEIYSPASGDWEVVSTNDGIDNTFGQGFNDANNLGYGNQVRLRNTDTNEGLSYSHLQSDSLGVEPGQILQGSTLIGNVGNSGNSTGGHLDLEYYPDGSFTYGTAANPRDWEGIDYYLPTDNPETPSTPEESTPTATPEIPEPVVPENLTPVEEPTLEQEESAIEQKEEPVENEVAEPEPPVEEEEPENQLFGGAGKARIIVPYGDKYRAIAVAAEENSPVYLPSGIWKVERFADNDNISAAGGGNYVRVRNLDTGRGIEFRHLQPGTIPNFPTNIPVMGGIQIGNAGGSGDKAYLQLQFFDDKDQPYDPSTTDDSDYLGLVKLSPEEAKKEGAGIEGHLETTSTFGYRDLDGDGKKDYHDGYDITSDAPRPDIFCPPGRWKVLTAVDNIKRKGFLGDYEDNDGWGNELIIENLDTGETLQYGHMAYKSVPVEEGQEFEGPAKIGEMGSTGNSTGVHTHITYWDENGTKKSVAQSPYADFYDAHEINHDDGKGPKEEGWQGEKAGAGEPKNKTDIAITPGKIEDDEIGLSYETEDYENQYASVKVIKKLWNGFDVIVASQIKMNSTPDDKQLVQGFLDLLDLVEQNSNVLLTSVKDPSVARIYYQAGFVPYDNIYASAQKTTQLAKHGSVLMAYGVTADRDDINDDLKNYASTIVSLYGREMARELLQKAQNYLDLNKDIDAREALLRARRDIVAGDGEEQNPSLKETDERDGFLEIL